MCIWISITCHQPQTTYSLQTLKNECNTRWAILPFSICNTAWRNFIFVLLGFFCTEMLTESKHTLVSLHLMSGWNPAACILLPAPSRRICAPSPWAIMGAPIGVLQESLHLLSTDTYMENSNHLFPYQNIFGGRWFPSHLLQSHLWQSVFHLTQTHLGLCRNDTKLLLSTEIFFTSLSQQQLHGTSSHTVMLLFCPIPGAGIYLHIRAHTYVYKLIQCLDSLERRGRRVCSQLERC